MSQTIFRATHISFVRPCISLWWGSLTSPKALSRQGVLLARSPIRGCRKLTFDCFVVYTVTAAG